MDEFFFLNQNEKINLWFALLHWNKTLRNKFQILSLHLLYILTSIWMLLTPSPAQNMLFSCFSHEKQKKEKKEERGKMRKSGWQNVKTKNKSRAIVIFNFYNYLVSISHFSILTSVNREGLNKHIN